MFLHKETVGRVELAFTDREGGFSKGPWASLNLGTSNGDDPQAVQRNVDLLSREMALERMVRMSQSHGTDVAWTDEVPEGEVPTADVLLTDRPGTGVLVRVADCLPIALVGLDEPAAGVVHCGRQGLVEGVVISAVASMRERGIEAIEAWLGPRACGRCYELPEAMADEIGLAVPGSRSTTTWGTPAIDIGAGAAAQLHELGVPVNDIGALMCTIEGEQYFSYRRQGQLSGRFGAVAVVR